MFKEFSHNQRLLIKFWLPAIVAGLFVGLLLIAVGDTPVIRASGLSLVIVGVTATLRRMGALLAFISGLTLALTPAFWSQTGGGEGDPATIVIALLVAAIVMIALIYVSKHPYIGIAVGVGIFVILFWSQIGTPRSVRLTSLVMAWLMYLIVDMLLLTNPRTDDDQSAAPPILLNKSLTRNDKTGGYQAQSYHWGGILFLLFIGIVNDPLLIMMIPAAVLALALSHTELRWWYWLGVGVIAILGIYGVFTDYAMAQAHFFVLDEWRNASRWIEVVEFIIGQFTIFGVGLGVLGLARLSRWYPPLGTVTMVGYAAYTFFGLIYVGPRAEVLLLPLLIIQVIWITYAIFALGEWLVKTNSVVGLRWVIGSLYCIVPLWMLSNLL